MNNNLGNASSATSNVSIDTGFTYTTPFYNFDDLMSDPYSIGNISLAPLLTGATNSPQGSIYNLTTASSTYSIAPSTSMNPKIHLGATGIKMDAECDIEIGETSLKEFMNKIEQRLALLIPNSKLEKEWHELKDLGDRYRELEQDIKEKMKTWDILSKNDDTNAQI